jgi:hypothetical protein
MFYITFAALCVREIYVAMALLLPAAEPITVTMTTHKFSPLHDETTTLFAFGMTVHLPEDRPENDKPKPLRLRET